MKSPEEIANAVLEAGAGALDALYAPFEKIEAGDVHEADVVAWISAAIKADRAQPLGRLESLYAYDWTPRGEDVVRSDDETPEAPILIVQIDTPTDIGRIRVYINDGRIYDGDPETGQEWSLT
jgi:hypothetical protein